jgi:hypothetical protein
MGRAAKSLLLILAAGFLLELSGPGELAAAEISAPEVLDSIGKARRFLLSAQQPDGSWSTAVPQHAIGATSLALLALLNSGMSASDPEIRRGLEWLRGKKPGMTYDISLTVQALAAARDGDVDKPTIAALAQRLAESQIAAGPHAGSWTYNRAGRRGDGDRSNGQFAVLALRDAREMGIPVSPATWRQARQHWLSRQNGDGGWDYKGTGRGGRSSGSMTVAGIATLAITDAMLKGEGAELDGDGHPLCCSGHEFDQPLEDAYRWLGSNFAVTRNPGAGSWLYYYMYGLERAGRSSGRRFFISDRGKRYDWYREGAEFLVRSQNRSAGTWRAQSGNGADESNPVVATSFALMFLSKGLAPVLINKLEYRSHDDAGRPAIGKDWNRHKDDVRNLTQLVGSLPNYPRLVTWQTVDVAEATLPDLTQAPILFLSGTEAPQFAPPEVALLQEYILHGGFILAGNNCQSAVFDDGFRDLVRRMYPESPLKKLTAEHPVFRSEFNLVDEATGEPTAELWGVDIGCRTSIMYSPRDISCLWDKWTAYDVPGRSRELVSMITDAMHVGVNVVAYVTGRKLLNKMERQEQVAVGGALDKIERDLLQISKMKYSGDWDAAPRALKNLLVALHATAGVAVSTRQRDLTLLDPNLFRYPVVYMHGRYEFALAKAEQDKLRDYLKQGGVLFSDACCGLPAFDRSFRRLMEQLFPDTPLKQIPHDHELFTPKVGHDLKSVKLREPDAENAKGGRPVSIREVAPVLEGIELNGRYVVVYSKHDISCALEGEASTACTGYVHDDAVRIGVNVILYALLQ